MSKLERRSDLQLGDLVILSETEYDYRNNQNKVKSERLAILVRWVDTIHHEVGIFLVGSLAEEYWTANVSAAWKIEE